MRDLMIQSRAFFMFIADLAVAFFALVLTIFIRYPSGEFYSKLDNHLLPFLIVSLFFTLIFYVFNIYSFRFNKNITELTNSFMKSMAVSFAIAILIFYIFGNFFELTPKTNLLIFTLIFGIIDFYLHVIFKRHIAREGISRRVMIVSTEENDLIDELKKNQNMGYKIVKKANSFSVEEIMEVRPDIVVINKTEEADLNKIYSLIGKEIYVYTLNTFYEEVFQKVPTGEIRQEKVVEYLSKNKTFFNLAKRVMDILLSLVLILILSPVFVLIAILVKLTSEGPAWIRQKRISKNGEVFVLYKFRSMIAISKDGQAEKDGAVWAKDGKEDLRVTKFGRFLRASHLDETPQLFNVLKGDISFVGPRPERPEFTKPLEKDILYYDLRHCVKAGITGWAQVNYKYGSSVEDAREKLRYDFYYIKNRTVFFDFLIILKTIAKIFTN